MWKLWAWSLKLISANNAMIWTSLIQSNVDCMPQTHDWHVSSPVIANVFPASIESLNANQIMTLEGPPKKVHKAKENVAKKGLHVTMFWVIDFFLVISKLKIGHFACLFAHFFVRSHEEHFDISKAFQICVVKEIMEHCFSLPFPIGILSDC